VVISNGTHVGDATIGTGLAFSGGTLSAGVTLDGGGHVPFALMQPELQNVPLAISHPGTMANSEVLMIVPLKPDPHPAQRAKRRLRHHQRHRRPAGSTDHAGGQHPACRRLDRSGHALRRHRRHALPSPTA